MEGVILMDRRKFLALTTKLSVATALPISLYGCGKDSSKSTRNELPAVEGLSTVEGKIAEFHVLKTDVDTTHTTLNSNLSRDIQGNSTIPRRSASMITSQFFADQTPSKFTQENNLLRKQKGGSAYPLHYLDSKANLSGTDFWSKAINSHQLAYNDYQQQLTKLLASLRLFDAKNTSKTPPSSPKRISLDNTRSVPSVLVELLKKLLSSTEGMDLSNSSTAGLVASLLIEIRNYLLNTEFAQSIVLKVFSVVSKMLLGLHRNSLSNVSFENKNQAMLSLSKISVASAAILGVHKISQLENSVDENSFVETELYSSDIMSKLSLIWIDISQNLIDETVKGAIGKINQANQKGAYSGSGDNVDADSVVADKLHASSAIMAMTSLAIKLAYNNFSDQLETEKTAQTRFNPSSDASDYKSLFTMPSNPYDDELVANSVNLSSNSFADYDSQIGLSSAGYTVPTTRIRSSSPKSTSSNSERVYRYAEEIAAIGSVIGAPVDFASQLAEYAYNFATQGMKHGFDFAMQGMEYGYLFASKGEEVGVMADRMLWMAVQIGIMADRIGEMADRIVYTAQLIVQTEILILDFGILIYGVIKQMTSGMLMTMALILDREWYGDVAIAQSYSEDAILTTIGANVEQMLVNMNSYSLAVIDSQEDLRQSTLDALEWLPDRTNA